jgi:LysM repeat protein
VTIVSPKNGALLTGSDVEISVSFTASARQPVSRVQISLDGKSVTERTYESRLASGECGFLWDTVRTEDGQHRLDAQVYSGKVFLGMATSVVTVANNGVVDQEIEPPARDIKPPQVKIESPTEGETVSGKVPVIIQAKDNSGKPPFISVFVDKSLKAVTNREPFKYTWDSSQAENGPHEIHVSALDDAENRTVTQPVRVFVRNSTKAAPMLAEVTKAPLSPANGRITPREPPLPVTESARSDDPAAQSFEVVQGTPVETGTAHASPPPARETEPEVAVLVSGPTEVYLAAEPEVASARIDEPKKPVTDSMPEAEPAGTIYVVRSGDALWTIARRYGTTVDALAEENGLKDPSLIRIGQKLWISGGTDEAVMVSLRSVFDAVGGRLGWDAKAHAVHAWAPGTEVRVWIGSLRAEVNDTQVVMERPAALQSGRTMVPRSFVTEELDLP